MAYEDEGHRRSLALNAGAGLLRAGVTRGEARLDFQHWARLRLRWLQAASGQSERGRVDNQRAAMARLTSKLIVFYGLDAPVARRTTSEVIRHYHAERNEVKDEASGMRRPFGAVLEGRALGEMIEARKLAVGSIG